MNDKNLRYFLSIFIFTYVKTWMNLFISTFSNFVLSTFYQHFGSVDLINEFLKKQIIELFMIYEKFVAINL